MELITISFALGTALILWGRYKDKTGRVIFGLVLFLATLGISLAHGKKEGAREGRKQALSAVANQIVDSKVSENTPPLLVLIWKEEGRGENLSLGWRTNISGIQNVEIERPVSKKLHESEKFPTEVVMPKENPVVKRLKQRIKQLEEEVRKEKERKPKTKKTSRKPSSKKVEDEDS
jgi:hypothetical protein